jgi:hypothetical protein
MTHGRQSALREDLRDRHAKPREDATTVERFVRLQWVAGIWNCSWETSTCRGDAGVARVPSNHG